MCVCYSLPQTSHRDNLSNHLIIHIRSAWFPFSNLRMCKLPGENVIIDMTGKKNQM